MKNFDFTKRYGKGKADVFSLHSVVSRYSRFTGYYYCTPPARNGRFSIVVSSYEQRPKIGDLVTMEVRSTSPHEGAGRIIENHGPYLGSGSRIYIGASWQAEENPRDSFSPFFLFGEPEPNGECLLVAITKLLKRSRLDMKDDHRHSRIALDVDRRSEREGRDTVIVAYPANRGYLLSGEEIFVGQADREIGSISFDDIDRQYPSISEAKGVMAIADESHYLVLMRDGKRWESKPIGLSQGIRMHFQANQKSIPVILAPKGTPMEFVRDLVEGYGFETELLAGKRQYSRQGMNQ